MTLAKFSNRYFPNLNRFFDDDWFSPMNLGSDSWNFADSNATLPAVNVTENNDEYAIEVAAPGLKKSDFSINYDNGRLTISCEKKDEKEYKEGEKVTRREFNYQSFQRAFSIPEEAVKSDRINAKYNEGILRITLPKKEEVKPKPAKQIAIN